MKDQLSKRINSLPVSATLAMAAKARELKAAGKDIISLSLGEPDFNTPDFIKEAAVQAIHDNYSSYSPVDGYVDLKDAIITKFKRDNNIDYNQNQIVVSTGAKQSIANVAMVLLNPGDEVLLPAPYWVSYSAIAILCEAKFVEVPSSIDTDFKITPEQLEAAITPKTKMVFFNSPNNPSGTIYTEKEYRALAKVLEKHPQIYILSDEIYEHINYSGKHESIAQFESIRNQVAIVNGVSKGYAMTGWRLNENIEAQLLVPSLHANSSLPWKHLDRNNPLDFEAEMETLKSEVASGDRERKPVFLNFTGHT